MEKMNYKTLSAKYLYIAILWGISTQMFSQGKVEDYQRAWNLRNEYNSKVKNIDIKPRAIGDTHKFQYTLSTKDSSNIYVIDADNNTISFANNKISEELNFKSSWERENNKQHTWHDERHHWMTSDPENDLCGTRINGDTEIYWKENNLFARNIASNEIKQITFDGCDTCFYSSHVMFSPDGSHIATVKIIPAPKHMITYINSSPKEQIQPQYSQLQYTKPGDSLDFRIPVIINLTSNKVYTPSTEYFQNQYNVSAPYWDNNATITFEYNERGHKTYRVLEMDTIGNVRILIEETSPKYVAYSRNFRHDFNDGKRILWKSDRDGHAHLYLYDRDNNQFCKQITNGNFWVREIQHIDEKNNIIWFSANGRNPEEDPYFIHYYKINIDGTGLTDLTPEKGMHKATFTRDMAYFIDTYSTVENPPVFKLRSGIDGHEIREIAKADISQLKKSSWKAPEVFIAKGRDGKTDMWGIIQRPSNFNPHKKYPVIEYIYSGPGDQYVPKSFSTWHWYLSDLAELGFIVVQLDAMTTSFRTKEFEEVCYKNLKDSGFPDRIEWIKAAAKKYPYMDISNMGIYGCSAGGQEALGALLFYGDFYKVAYSACGCHDNRMDKIWWNEQWMGTVDDSYSECSNVDNAKNLKGKLMLVVGEMDDNVDPASTFQVVNALIKANKDFEFIYLPGAKHTMGEKYGEHKRYDFFVKNILGVEPPSWDKFK